MADQQDESIDVGNGATLTLPAAYVEFEGLSEAKEWLRTKLQFGSGEECMVTFATIVRLGQDVADELVDHRFFFEPNLIIVSDIMRATLIGVAREIAQLGFAYLEGKRQ